MSDCCFDIDEDELGGLIYSAYKSGSVIVNARLYTFKCAMNFTGAKLLPCHFGYGFSFHPDSEYIAKSAEKYEEFLLKF